MPLKTKPEDYPAAVRFSVAQEDSSLQVTCSSAMQGREPPYQITGGDSHFPDRDAFQKEVQRVGMTPAVATDQGRSFNATARQLRGLGFSVEMPGESP